MKNDEADLFYNQCVAELYNLIPKAQLKEVFEQDECELEHDFLGFVNVYKPLSQLIPKDCVVIDFGCYLAAQSYFFKDHALYIGIDTTNLIRFTANNTFHLTITIQDFISAMANKLIQRHGNKICAICSYVPDHEAVKLVKNTFNNVFCYYP